MPSRVLNPPPQSPVGELALSVSDTQSAGVSAKESVIRLSSLEGSVVALLVLGIDCSTCKHVAKSLSSLHYEYRPEVSFVGVCLQSGCSDRLAEFNREAQAAFPLAHYTSRELRPALGIPNSTWLFFPTMIFLDRQHRLRGLFVGGDEFFKDVANHTRAVLDNLLLEPAAIETCSEATV
jgi:hypothetical protein